MEKLIPYLTMKANKATTQTEFLKSLQFNDRYGCITVPNADGFITYDSERVYPELNGTLVSVFLKSMFKTINAK